MLESDPSNGMPTGGNIKVRVCERVCVCLCMCLCMFMCMGMCVFQQVEGGLVC